jgi:hypothetical protein
LQSHLYCGFTVSSLSHDLDIFMEFEESMQALTDNLVVIHD